MARLKRLVGPMAVKFVQASVPQRLRRLAIKVLLRAESGDPRESIRWLLPVYDNVGRAIDEQCLRWGNGVHIKHELMDGIHSFFYERIPAGAHVLDVGCGYGAVAYSIVTHTEARVLGVDLSEESLAFAREHFRHPNLRFERCDVTQDKLPGERVDVVVLSSVIEHLPNRIELLRTLVDRFAPSLFLIRVPMWERHFFVALKRELGLFPYTDSTHLIEYSPESFAAEMQQAGLGIRSWQVRWGDIWAECVPQVERAEAKC